MSVKTKTRAKIDILSRVAASYLAVKDVAGIWGVRGVTYGAQDKDLQPGDLVALSSCLSTEWCFSWYVRKIEPDTHLLESIETGKLCRWSNVSIARFPREEVEQNPQWRWSDAKFKFYDRLRRAWGKSIHNYILRPMTPVFNEDGSVVVRFRESFTNNIQLEKTFPSWRKLLSRDVVSFINGWNETIEA